MEVLLSQLPNYGVLALIVGVLLYQNNKISSKLTSIIESNTRALAELKAIIETSVERRRPH